MINPYSKDNPGNFANDPDRARRAGQKGGKKGGKSTAASRFHRGSGRRNREE